MAKVLDTAQPGIVIAEGVWCFYQNKMGINQLVSDEAVAPNGGVPFHDTIQFGKGWSWVRIANVKYGLSIFLLSGLILKHKTTECLLLIFSIIKKPMKFSNREFLMECAAIICMYDFSDN